VASLIAVGRVLRAAVASAASAQSSTRTAPEKSAFTHPPVIVPAARSSSTRWNSAAMNGDTSFVLVDTARNFMCFTPRTDRLAGGKPFELHIVPYVCLIGQ
jgi:hypothetical protein